MKEDKRNQLNDSITIAIQEEDFASKEEVIEALEQAYQNIREFHTRLLYLALSKIRLYFRADSFRSITAEDVVQNILGSILDQRRKWYRNKIPDFSKFVRLAIISYIRDQYKKKEQYEEPEDLTDHNPGNELVHDMLNEQARKDFVKTHNGEDIEALCQQYINELKDDVYAAFVLDERCNGLKSNKEIARRLGLEVREVENARKRIRTRFRGLKQKK